MNTNKREEKKTVKIRFANIRDVQAITAIAQDPNLFMQPGDTYSESEIKTYVQDGQMLVAVDSEVIGALWFDLIGCLYINGVVVCPNQRGRGIGRQLVESAEKLAVERELDVEFQTLQENAAMQGLAISMGYKQGGILKAWRKITPSLPQNESKKEEKKCGEACLSHYGPVALYQYENSDKTFWLCNAALFEELRRGEKVIPSLPQNGDREKEIDIDGCPECPHKVYSEGKEKEPKEEMVEIPFSVAEDIVHSALAEKETAPKTDWEERFESIKIQCADDSENHNREIKAFIQTLLKEKDEEFVRDLNGTASKHILVAKYSPKDKN